MTENRTPASPLAVRLAAGLRRFVDVVGAWGAWLIIPVVAPTGTVARICVSESTVKAAGVPLKATAVVPVNLLPVIVTSVVPR